MLEVGGLVLLADGLAMALGTMAAPRVAEAFGDRRAVPWLLGCSSLCLAALSLATSVWTFVAIRFVQVLCIAPVFPLAVAAIAHRASGGAIGLLNSARIGASFVGPVFATTLLAWFPPSSVELAWPPSGFSWCRWWPPGGAAGLEKDRAVRPRRQPGGGPAVGSEDGASRQALWRGLGGPTTCRSRSAPASSTRCWVRPAAGRPRCSGWWPGSPRRTPAGSSSTTSRSTPCRRGSAMSEWSSRATRCGLTCRCSRTWRSACASAAWAGAAS